MTKRRILQAIAVLVALFLIAWAVSAGLERLVTPRVATTPTPEAPTAAETAHITATLFYAAQNGQSLVTARREVPLAEGVIAQGRAILAAQLEAAPAPLLSVIPKGTSLRGFYVTGQGDAFVDLSAELSRAHPGGSLNEMFTVYALVNAVTANLPTIRRVQLLVDGREVDTLAGHVDIRRPLVPDDSLVRAEGSGAAPPADKPPTPDAKAPTATPSKP